MFTKAAQAVLTVILACIVGIPPSSVGAATSNVIVTARVLPYVRIHAVQRRHLYTVTSADIRKGFIDLPDSAILSITTNVQSDLVVALDSGLGESMLASIGGRPFTPGPLRLEGAKNGHAAVSESLNLRILLASGVKEGTYPLNVMVQPLVY